MFPYSLDFDLIRLPSSLTSIEWPLDLELEYPVTPGTEIRTWTFGNCESLRFAKRID